MKVKVEKITALIQARIGSSRLPGKTLMTIKGESLLGHLIRRIKASKYVTDIVIATTTKEIDDAIVKFAKDRDIKYYRGSEEDVLDRFYKASVEYGIETIVRVTPDCPMLDPQVMDSVISQYINGDYNYVSNTINPTYPDGLDVEVFSFQALKKAWKEAKLPSEREHVTPYIYNHHEFFKIGSYENDVDLFGMRWVVDEEADYKFITEVYKNLYKDGEIFYMRDVLDLLSKQPELSSINKNIMRNEGYIKSLKKNKDE